MPLFGGLFKSKDGAKTAKGKQQPQPVVNSRPLNPPWQDSWDRTVVQPEEIYELVHLATQEIKARDLDAPLFLLPFRPDSTEITTAASAKNFVNQFYKAKYEGTGAYSGKFLAHELLLSEPVVLWSIMKWCWSRLPGGVVTWDTYEMFRIGEEDSNMAANAFGTFIPLSVENDARKQIIFCFFDLLAAVAARGKSNGLGGRKLSRLAGWWAFELSDAGKGFDGGYSSWISAANACSHLFFAYLRSLNPEQQPGLSGISTTLPRSLLALLSQTEYPPQTPALMQTSTSKVVMIVDSVSPTPFSLLRRAKNFEYRDSDVALQQFSSYDDPVRALTDECRRVLEAIASSNTTAKDGDATWSKFQSAGFSQAFDTQSNPNNVTPFSPEFGGLRSTPRSKQTDFGRPTTPSWADFLSSGFAEENNNVAKPMLLPPDKQLPPIGDQARVKSSQSHMNHGFQNLEPGELASITHFELDETFWWVWMTSLAREETDARKAVFGRCALIEVRISGAKWLVIEEQIQGASPGPEKGAYIAEKKSKWSFTSRGRLGRRKSIQKKPPPVPEPYNRSKTDTPMSKVSIAPDQQARVKQAAQQLAYEQQQKTVDSKRRGRRDEDASVKTNSVLTLQPDIMSAASPAMKWANEFDKNKTRNKYLQDSQAGTGKTADSGNNENKHDVKKSEDRSASSREAQPNGAPPIGASPGLAAAGLLPAGVTSTKDLPLPPSPSVQRKSVGSGAPTSPVPHSFNADNTPANSFDKEISGGGPFPADEKAPLKAELAQHPALRTSDAEEPRSPPPPAKDTPPAPAYTKPSAPSMPTIPPRGASQPKDQRPTKKLTKQAASGGGFKRFFGGKKGSDDANQPESSVPAAPRETLTKAAPTTQPKSQPIVAPPAAPEPVAEPVPVAASGNDIEHSQVRSPAFDPESLYQDKTNGLAGPEISSSQFHQGPLEDVPAFVPEDSAPNSPVVQHTAERTEPARQVPHDSADVSPVDEVKEHDAVVGDNQSEASIELHRQITPAQDRWAQIRKNAAERAARMSEEKTQPSTAPSARTDDGETSGEETIEDRVARIKARVAELTGSMDAQGNIRTTARS